jgi:hypothetical protein
MYFIVGLYLPQVSNVMLYLSSIAPGTREQGRTGVLPAPLQYKNRTPAVGVNIFTSHLKKMKISPPSHPRPGPPNQQPHPSGGAVAFGLRNGFIPNQKK